MSRATTEEFENRIPGNARHSKYVRIRRDGKRRLRRIRHREESAFCRGNGGEPRIRHTGGWCY